ncbi:MAG: primase, partial [Frankiales bacterium]|nr:primase [Frankiales bacterium]
MHALVRRTLLAGLTGALTVSAAWAGVGLGPVPGVDAPSLPSAPSATRLATDVTTAALATPAPPAAAAADDDGDVGGVLVGAAKNSIYPRPQDMQARFPGARWERDLTKCRTLSADFLADVPTNALNALDGVASTGSPWPENPDCIYQGGFGIGPMNPVKDFDTTSEGGLNVRSVALRQGGKVLVLSVLDAEGWLWDYKSKCTDCGAKQISAALAADPELKAVGFTPASYVLHATHSHAAPDFIGGWGFVPDWYMAQVTDTIKKTVKQAVLAAQP